MNSVYSINIINTGSSVEMRGIILEMFEKNCIIRPFELA